MKMNIGKVALSAVLFAIVGYIVHMVSALLTMKYYTMPQYVSVWSKLMMPTAGPPPASFTMYSLLFGVISGILFTVVYTYFRTENARTQMQRGLMYGLIVFLIAAIPGFFAMLLLINIPIVLLFAWLLENLVIYLIGGIIVSVINK